MLILYVASIKEIILWFLSTFWQLNDSGISALVPFTCFPRSCQLSVEGRPWHASESLAHHALYSRSRTLDLNNNPSGSYIPHPPPTFSILSN